MTTQQEIEIIEGGRYNGYKGSANRALKVLHDKLRERIGDAQYLIYLKKIEIENPRPKFNPSIDISIPNP